MYAIEAPVKKLTTKEKRFAEAYIGESKGNATAAARVAGYKDGPSLRWTASDLLAKPHVRAYIDGVLDAETASAAEVLRELTDVGIAEWKNFLQVLPTPKQAKSCQQRWTSDQRSMR